MSGMRGRDGIDRVSKWDGIGAMLRLSRHTLSWALPPC